MKGIITSAAILLLGSWCAHAVAQRQTAATFLAIVRYDGALVPIAIHDGREWWNRWPWAGESDEEVKSLRVPATTGSVPADWLPPGVVLPADWRMLSIESGTRQTLRATRPARQPGFQLVSTIVLLTDLPRPSTPETSSGEEPIGVALAGAGELGRFTSPPEAITRRITNALQPRLDALEADALAEWKKERESNGAAKPVTLTRTYRHGDDARRSPFGLSSTAPVAGKVYHYLTGEKLYKLGLKDSPDCKVNLSFEGVLTTATDGRVIAEKISAFAYAEYCGDAASWMEPLATLHLNGRILWICRDSVEDGYEYALFDPETTDRIPLKGEWQFRER